MKRLAVLICSLTTGLYFIGKVDIGSYGILQKNKVILLLSFGWLLSSLVFWKLPSTAQYANYSWFKFAGATALILFLIQIFIVGRLSKSITIWILLGLSLAGISILNSAKSFALLTLILMFLRIGMLGDFRIKVSIEQKFSSNRYKMIRTIVVTIISITAIVFFARSGLFGTRIELLAAQYGNSAFDSLFRARPEFTYSMQIIRDLPFLGYGTVADPFNHIQLQLVSSNYLTLQEQHFLLNRILVDGFNLHSWTFDLVVRAGFLCFIPLGWYAVLLVKAIFSLKLISNYPGLTFICIVSLEDLFFSPYSWFSSVQIAFSFLAIYMSRNPSKSIDESRQFAKLNYHHN